MTTDSFRFEYEPGTIVYGRESVATMGEELARRDVDRALLVTGSTVGNTPSVVDPVREGVGDRLAGVFAKTTPEKRLNTVLDGVERLRTSDADAVVSLGGGSSLDVATVMSVLATDDRSRETIRSEFLESGFISHPETDVLPVFVVPTTLAGADLSIAAGITADPDDRPTVHGGVFDERLMPEALVYDPALIETTPHEILCASAMNGFDKGIESLYAPNRTPITDATAMRGLTLLAEGLPRLGSGAHDNALHDAIEGTILVQYGVSRNTGSTLSLIHAFGHGISRGYDVQQGAAHAIIAPHALELLFDRVDGRCAKIAAALGVGASDDPATAVIDAVTDVRDSLGLPARLRSVPDLSREELSAVANAVVTDGLMENTPNGLDPTESEIKAVLENAW
ncbi:iron-containing alcohol dehydrogenase family protein [Halocatena salina]|uniref:Iron-containing alcohol dehydrogenase family protein n=1 Tax=Halocatena salina TaxID=2934340 RepID=A0A8T9ZYS1_9EURY|nr:iron-containing alcohol dehydrogenase family protein [Halocatena salina]UPM41861.1 iron-containing alcohol dehydrogenase family protein [Halocatena salina]